MNERKDKRHFLSTNMGVLLGALLCCALWGSAFPGIKLGYQYMHISSNDTAGQILFAGCRFFLAGFLAILIGSLLQKKMLIPKKPEIPKIVWLGILQTILQYVFFYIGLSHTSGVKASILNSLSTFFAVLIAGLLFHQEQITMRKLAGCLIGFSGVVLVNMAGLSGIQTFAWNGEGFLLLSTVAYAFSSVYLKIFSKNHNPVLLSGWQFVFGGLVMILGSLAVGGRFADVSPLGIMIMIYLAFVSAVAYSLWGILLKYNPVSKVTVFGFMTPIFGVLLSAVFLKEGSILNAASLAALLLVSFGIYVVNAGNNGSNKPDRKES